MQQYPEAHLVHMCEAALRQQALHSNLPHAHLHHRHISHRKPHQTRRLSSAPPRSPFLRTPLFFSPLSSAQLSRSSARLGASSSPILLSLSGFRSASLCSAAKAPRRLHSDPPRFLNAPAVPALISPSSLTLLLASQNVPPPPGPPPSFPPAPPPQLQGFCSSALLPSTSKCPC